ncbi:MAG: efflux RND transporter periplasmic adaptor subunit [Pseudomonadota bacterium]
MIRIWVVMALLAGGGWWAYQHYFAKETAVAEAAPGPQGPPGGMPVEAEKIVEQKLAREIIAVGSLRSDESVKLSAEIGGRVSAIRFTEGQAVERGAVLFELEDSVLQAELAQSRASLTLSQRNAARSADLFSKGLVSARERDEAAAKLALDEASVKLAEARLDKTRIRAPFAGIAGLRLISPGAYVQPGDTLVALEALQTLKADFRLSEAALSVVSVGQILNLEVDAYPGQTFAGKVYAIDPGLAVETRSIGLRARVPNAQGKLRPGLFARVKLIIAQKDQAITVAEQAVFPQGEQHFVYTIENGAAAMKPVGIGQRQDGRVEIVSGLKAGDTVITAGLQKIGPGAPVTAINLAAPAEKPKS